MRVLFLALQYRLAEDHHLCQDQAVVVQDVVAALPERRLGAEIGNDVNKPVPEVGDLQPCRNPLHQPQRVHIAPNMVQQSSCNQALILSIRQSLHRFHTTEEYKKAALMTQARAE